MRRCLYALCFLFLLCGLLACGQSPETLFSPLKEAQTSDTTNDTTSPKKGFLAWDLYRILVQWDGSDSALFRTFAIRSTSPNWAKEFLAYASKAKEYRPLVAFVGGYDLALEASLKANVKGEEGAFRWMIENDHPLLNLWQSTVLKDRLSFQEYVKKQAPQLYEEWNRNRTIPARSESLPAFAKRVFPEQADALLETTGIGVKPSGPTGGGTTGGGRSPCTCQLIFSANNTPAQYYNPGMYDEYSTNKHRSWWEESEFASHYAEAYVEGWNEYLEITRSTLRRQNKSAIHFKMVCTDGNGSQCAGCSARVNIFAMYGSKLQVHNWDDRTNNAKSAATAMDSAKMKLTLGNGSIHLFEKSLILAQTRSTTWDESKVKNIINGIGSAYKQIKKDSNDNLVDSNDAAKYAEIASTIYTNAKSMVTITGKAGLSTETMYVEYNTNSNVNAPTHSIQQGVDYSLQLETDGSIVYEGKKWHKTNNTAYGSASGIAVSINQFMCTQDVIAPQTDGCWIYSGTYRNPYGGTATLSSNIRQFLQYNLAISQINTNTTMGCVR